jgi:hypothetical protein
MRRSSTLPLALWTLGALACSKATMVDYVVGSAFRPGKMDLAPLPKGPHYQLLAGDMHCHVSPPDDPSDVSRGLPATVTLARKEGLDFVVLTPHVWSRFFMNEELRQAVVDGQRTLRDTIAKQGHDVLLVPGFEYTDHTYGHVGMSFADVEDVLEAVPLAVAQAHPERFMETWVGKGGVLVVNHPLVTPIDSVFAMARADLSWRPFTAKGPFPAEITAVNRLAQGFEAFNLTAAHLRDRWLLHDGGVTTRTTLARLDREIVEQGRRMTPVGGSDSHSMHLRATTFVLATARTVEAVHEAVVAGRTCVRDASACTLTARARGKQVGIGGALGEVDKVEAAATGDDIELILDGAVVATPKSDSFVSIDVPKKCSVLRAHVNEGYSAPIYLNCPFAKS